MAKIRSEMRLDGDQMFLSLLKQAPKKAKASTKKTVNAGATPILKEVRKGVREMPERSGLLRQSPVKTVKSYTGGNSIALIGASKAASGEYRGRRAVPANYWHLILGGVKAHTVSNSGHSYRHPGLKGRNILQQAVDATASQVRSIMEAKMKEVVEKEIAKIGG